MRYLPSTPLELASPSGKSGGLRVEQNARRFQRGRPEEDRARVELHLVVGLGVDHADAADPSGARIPDHLGDDAVGAQGHAAGGFRGGQGCVERAEVAAGAASPVTGAAVVAGAAPLVVAGENRGPSDRHAPRAAESAVDGTRHVLLDARHLHRRQEDAVRHLRQPFRPPADADERLDVVVPGRQVRVADGPVDAVSLARIGLEVQVGQPVALPGPHDRPAAHLPSADPQEGLVGFGRVRVLDVVDEELAAHFVAGVALALDRLFGRHRLTVVPAAVRHLVRGEVFGVVALGHDHRPRLEDEHAGPQLGQLLGCPTARHAGADNDRVVLLAARADVEEMAAGDRHRPASPRGRPASCGVSGAHPSNVRNVVRYLSASSPTSDVK